MNKLEDINYPNIDYVKINNKIDNKFVLSIGVAKRAKQLKEGIKPLVDYDPDRPCSYILIALKEIELGKISIELDENDQEQTEYLEEMDNFLDQELKNKEQKLDKKGK